MSQICIQIPPLHQARTVELEVKVDGESRLLNYRVETFEWDEWADTATRITRLREAIAHYDTHWELVQIGPPDGSLIPIMFRERVPLAASGPDDERASDDGA